MGLGDSTHCGVRCVNTAIDVSIYRWKIGRRRTRVQRDFIDELVKVGIGPESCDAIEIKVVEQLWLPGSVLRITCLVVQIEGKNALDNVAEIAAVPGLDCVFVGPYDLALSMGLAPGSPEVFAAAAEIASSVPNGLGMGIYIDDPGKCSDWMKRGFALQCVSYDGRMLSNGARSVVQQANEGMTALTRDVG